jgi:hypothetical protein
MTTDYPFTWADGEINFKIMMVNSADTLLNSKMRMDRKADGWFLIYLGRKYDENAPKIKDFSTCFKNPSLNHVSFPLNGAAVTGDSLYLIWFD